MIHWSWSFERRGRIRTILDFKPLVYSCFLFYQKKKKIFFKQFIREREDQSFNHVYSFLGIKLRPCASGSNTQSTTPSPKRPPFLSTFSLPSILPSLHLFHDRGQGNTGMCGVWEQTRQLLFANCPTNHDVCFIYLLLVIGFFYDFQFC